MKFKNKINWQFKFLWVDLWMGFYLDRTAKALYFCPLPMLCFKFWLTRRVQVFTEIKSETKVVSTLSKSGLPEMTPELMKAVREHMTSNQNSLSSLINRELLTGRTPVDNSPIFPNAFPGDDRQKTFYVTPKEMDVFEAARKRKKRK